MELYSGHAPGLARSRAARDASHAAKGTVPAPHSFASSEEVVRGAASNTALRRRLQRDGPDKIKDEDMDADLIGDMAPQSRTSHDGPDIKDEDMDTDLIGDLAPQSRPSHARALGPFDGSAPGDAASYPELCEPGTCTGNDEETCFYDPGCATGGLGCNAGGKPLCRFCGFGVYSSVACPGPCTVEDNIQVLFGEFENCYTNNGSDIEAMRAMDGKNCSFWSPANETCPQPWLPEAATRTVPPHRPLERAARQIQ